MNIIKRDGSQAVFDACKIASAIRKANATVDEADRLTEARILRIAHQIERFAAGHDRALGVMKKLNEYTAAWKQAENIDYSLYGTPLESTTYRFAQCLQRRFGIVPGVTDRNYITNSYHVHVTEPIDAFAKLALEAKFQTLSPGGAISYVEVPNLQDNIPAVLALMQFIYDHIMYAELNTKSDYCQACGYIGSQYQGRTQEIKERLRGRARGRSVRRGAEGPLAPLPRIRKPTYSPASSRRMAA